MIFLVLLCYLAKFAYRFVQIWVSESIDKGGKYVRTDLSRPKNIPQRPSPFEILLPKIFGYRFRVSPPVRLTLTSLVIVVR